MTAQQIIDKYKDACMNNEPVECAIMEVKAIIEVLKAMGLGSKLYDDILKELEK